MFDHRQVRRAFSRSAAHYDDAAALHLINGDPIRLHNEIGTLDGRVFLAPIARGDLRTLTPEQDERVRARMLAIVDDHLPLTDAELTFADTGYPPMAPSEGNRALLARLNAVNRDLGLPLMAEYDPARRGAADRARGRGVDGVGRRFGLSGQGVSGHSGIGPCAPAP